MPRRITVCPVSRHTGFAATLEHLLQSSEFRVTSLRLKPDDEPGLAAPDWAAADPLPHADVFVVDVGTTPIEAESLIERIRAEHPQSRILLVKETTTDEKVLPMLRIGVRGAVRYADAGKDLSNAVKAVSKGEFWVPPTQLARFVDELLATACLGSGLGHTGVLSRREREVLKSLAGGLTNKEIASALNISERTVKFHVSSLLRKLGAQRRTDLIARQYKLS